MLIAALAQLPESIWCCFVLESAEVELAESIDDDAQQKSSRCTAASECSWLIAYSLALLGLGQKARLSQRLLIPLIGWVVTLIPLRSTPHIASTGTLDLTYAIVLQYCGNYELFSSVF